MSKTQALVAALPYGLIIAALVAAGCGVPQLAWGSALVAGCTLVNPGAPRGPQP